MATSTVPAAVDALLDLLQAAPGLAAAAVVDGPPTVNLAATDRIHIGWQPVGEDTAVALTQDFNAAGARTRDETYDITSYAESRAGGTDMRGRRARVFELLAVVETTLRATVANPTAPTLGGAVLWAHLVTGNLMQAQTPDGAVAGLLFTVRCRARI